MDTKRRTSSERRLQFDALESRDVPTLVFILSGNALSATGPGALTAGAAAIVREAGDHPIQLSTPTINTPSAFYSVAKHIAALSHGQPIGIIGFSAGGVLALHLAAIDQLHVKDVLDDYGPPDARDYFAFHQNDYYAHYVKSHAHPDQAVIDLLSGPIHTTANVDCAFGLQDPNAVASMATASAQKDLPQANVFYYDGPHGVRVTACLPALDAFMSHL